MAPRPERAERPVGTEAPANRNVGNLVLDVQNLRTYFFTYDGVVRALEGIDLQARAGETTGVVGETGCGKSVTAFSIARLVSEPGRVISGKILLNGIDLLWGLEREAKYKRIGRTGRVKVIRRFRQIKAANERISAIRGRGVGMIFQEPTQAMNPVFSIADQLGEAVMIHRGIEVVDGLINADRGTPGASHMTEADFSGEGHAMIAAGSHAPVEEIEALVKAATEGKVDEMRAAARAAGAKMGLASIETELFHLARNAGRTNVRLRRQAYHAVRRVHLTNFQRRYLRHLRRLEILQKKMKDLYLKEMKAGRLYRGPRGRVNLQIRAEKLSHLYFGIAGLSRRARRPVKNELFWRAVQLLEGVNIANPSQVARGFPHELSGGMLQRAMIAMALSCEPGLLLADEPTTALDVTIQAQILELMRQLRERVGTAIVLITHDLGVVAEVCDRVNVMYAGVVVESGTVHEVFRRPLHPYTNGLLSSIPRFDQPDGSFTASPDRCRTSPTLRPDVASIPAAPTRCRSAGRSGRSRSRTKRATSSPATFTPKWTTPRPSPRRSPLRPSREPRPSS